MSVKSLDVFYKGRIVGTLAETADRRVAFQYSDDWLNDGFSIQPFFAFKVRCLRSFDGF